MTVWYYDVSEAKAARELAPPEEQASVSQEEREEASVFMRLVCAGERAGGTTRRTPRGPSPRPTWARSRPCARARRLSAGAYSIVASIVGAPSVEELKNAICTIEPQELVNLRVSFTRMGI